MIEPYKSKSVMGVKKALGQLNRVLQMLEDDAYCMDVLQQVRAVEGLLNSVSVAVLESHLNSCGEKAFASKDPSEKNKMIDEIIATFKASKK